MYSGICLNADGITQMKANEISDILNKHNNIMFYAVSELKQQQGESNVNLKIPGYEVETYARKTAHAGRDKFFKYFL